jgi:hypothetical protein
MIDVQYKLTPRGLPKRFAFYAKEKTAKEDAAKLLSALVEGRGFLDLRPARRYPNAMVFVDGQPQERRA